MLTVTDPDAGEDRFAEGSAAVLAGEYGDFSFDAETGAWSYRLDNDRDSVRDLGEDWEMTETLEVESLDGTATETITVTVTGTGPRPRDPETVPLTGQVLDRAGQALEGTTVTFIPDDAEAAPMSELAAAGFHLDLAPGMAGRLEASRPHDPATDSRPTALDALEVLRMAVGLEPGWGAAGPLDFIAADMNADGQVTALDALEVLRAAVGVESEHGPRWVFVDADADMSHIDRDTVAYDTGIMVGALTHDVEVSMTGILLGSIQEFA